MTVAGRKSNRTGYRLRSACLAFVALWTLFETVSARSQATGDPPSRPLLFVHGICANAYDVEPLLNNIYPQLDHSLYPSSTVYVVQFNSVHNTIQFWLLANPGTPQQLPIPVPETSIPSSARFFSIMLYDPISNSINADNVAKISILNKAYEVSQVIKHIVAITHVKDVTVLGHSMGGLDTRAYIENMASQGVCYDYNNNTPDYNPTTCKPGCNSVSCMPNATYGFAAYAGDIADLITLDTPHSGTPLASLTVQGANIPLGCPVGPKTNTYELEDLPNDLFGYLINALNYSGQAIANVTPSSNTVPIQAVQDYLTDVTSNTVWPLLSGESDDVVPLDSQSIPARLQTNSIASVASKLTNVPIPYLSSDISGNQGCFAALGPIEAQVLHYMSCLGTLPLTQTAVANEINAHALISQSGISAPSVTSLVATAIGSDGANLNGSVNPNGSPVTTWFDYGISNTLQSFQSTTPVQSIPSGTTSVPVFSSLSSQAANTKYYYRTAASNGVTTVRDTNIVSFTTLNTLPAPTLLAPANSSTGASVTPQLSWTAVPNATSGYRVMMSTSYAALPTDPNSGACSLGCVLGSTGATTSGTGFTPTAGELSPSTTYYWEVHGRSPTQAGTWSPIWSFTTASAVTNDYSIQVSPSSQSVPQGSSVAFNVVTATTSGSGQNIALSATNVPSGLTATFSPANVASGVQSGLTVAASSSAPTGTYTLTITATGTSATHTFQISVTIVQALTGPAVTLNPSIVRFNSQAVGSVSSPQTVLLMNSGSGQLQISSIALLAGSDYVLTLPSPVPPSILNSLVPYSIQVAFEPSTTGLRTGQILVYDNAPGSPHTVQLTGTGTSVQPSTGTINVSATLNGTALPASYYYSYSLTGPTASTGSGAYSYSVSPGLYSIAFSGNPSYLTLASVTPSSSPQSVTAGGAVNFTLNFTAPNDFYSPSFLTSGGGVTPQIVTTGSTANYTIGIGSPIGNASTPITLAVSGTPPNSNPVFNPQPVFSAAGSSLTVGTTSATPVGVYSLSLSGTNTSGLTHSGSTSTMVVTAPPSVPVQRASVTSAGGQANAASSTSYNAVSADGRYVVFSTPATNLATGNTYQYQEIYVRDLQSAATTPISVSGTGALADSGCYGGSISANGRFVVFWSGADNLYTGSVLNVNNGVYVRDLSQGLTEREDVAPNGAPANGTSFGSAISADGRFVAFLSNATNLIGGVSGLQAYVRDRNTGNVVLASAAMDGSPATAGSDDLAISADGRFVAFVSNATNLVSQNTNGLNEAFVRDMQTGVTYLVSISNTGVPANASIFTNNNVSPLGLSADGRFVTFSSTATNLVSQPLDGTIIHVFEYDRQLQQNALVDVDSVGTPLGGWSSFTAPSVSADGRFVTFYGFGQVLVRDVVADQTAVVSLASNGTAGDNQTTGNSNLSLAGPEVVFASGSTNLVANDTNGVSDAFVAQNPFVGSTSLQSLVLNSSSVSGGSTVIGTITLSSPAPSGGATVAVWSNNAAAQPSAVVVVSAGATSAPLSFSTSLVPSETVMTIMASYNGGSSAAVLTLEPAPELAISPPYWDFGYQAVGTSTAVESFAITNSGTAALTINTIQLSLGTAYSISANTCGTNLVAGSSCSVSVIFKPNASGSINDALQISYGGPAAIQSITLTGNGATPLASVSPVTLTFTSPGNPSATATLMNAGNASLTNISASISGVNAADFSISGDGCSGSVLPANSNCLISIAFSPKAAGTRLGTLSVTDSASGSPQAVGLSGIEVQTTPTVQWIPSLTSLTYGANLGSGVLDAIANANGNSIAGTFAYAATISGGTPQAVTATTVLGAGTYTLTVTFTPTDTTDYTTANGTASITISRATPTISWITPAAVTLGTVLSSTQLDATASVPGTFAYSPTAGTVMSTAGSTTLSVTFTPADTADYNTNTASVPLNVNSVNKTTPTITWSAPAAITYGTPLSATQLNATASIAGQFAYSPQMGVVLTTGQQVLSVTFTPTDTTDYNSNTANVTLTVNKATPTIIWNTPATVLIGTTLSATQLNATANVPGTFAYSPTAGTVMPTAGNTTLSTTFTPTDTTDYNGASATVILIVNPVSTPAFTISGTSVTVVAGATTGNTSSITVTPSGGFTGSVTLTAAITSSPSGVQYQPTFSFGSTSPVSIAGASAGTATLTISTSPATKGSMSYPARPETPWYTAGSAALACLLFFGIPGRRRQWQTMIGLVVLLVTFASGIVACGSGSSSAGGGTGNPGTTAGAYTVTVTGTSGATTKQGTISLTVQ